MRAAIVLIVLVWLAGCGRFGFDALTGGNPGIDSGGADDGGDAGGDAPAALAISSPPAESTVGATAVLAGSCTAGVIVGLSGDLTGPATTPCDTGSFSATITFTSGNGGKTITVTQGALTSIRHFVRSSPAVTYRSGAGGTQASAGAMNNCTLTVTRPAGVVDGDLLVGIIFTDGGSGAAIATPGWTTLSLSNPGNVAFYKVASGEPTSYAFAITAGTGMNDTCESAGAIAAFIGVNPTTPIVGEAKTTFSSVMAIVAPSVAVPTQGMLIAAFGSNGPMTGMTTPSAMMLASSATSPGDWADALVAYQPVAPGGSGTRTSNIGQMRDAAAVLIVLQP